MTVLLKTENLTKKYKDEIATEAVSFELEKNTSTALIGPNGAGKTTILSMLAGLVTPTCGCKEGNYRSKENIRVRRSW